MPTHYPFPDSWYYTLCVVGKSFLLAVVIFIISIIIDLFEGHFYSFSSLLSFSLWRLVKCLFSLFHQRFIVIVEKVFCLLVFLKKIKYFSLMRNNWLFGSDGFYLHCLLHFRGKERDSYHLTFSVFLFFVLWDVGGVGWGGLMHTHTHNKWVGNNPWAIAWGWWKLD